MKTVFSTTHTIKEDFSSRAVLINGTIVDIDYLKTNNLRGIYMQNVF
jgi:hypothetical protein